MNTDLTDVDLGSEPERAALQRPVPGHERIGRRACYRLLPFRDSARRKATSKRAAIPTSANSGPPLLHPLAAMMSSSAAATRGTPRGQQCVPTSDGTSAATDGRCDIASSSPGANTCHMHQRRIRQAHKNAFESELQQIQNRHTLGNLFHALHLLAATADASPLEKHFLHHHRLPTLTATMTPATATTDSSAHVISPSQSAPRFSPHFPLCLSTSDSLYSISFLSLPNYLQQTTAPTFSISYSYSLSSSSSSSSSCQEQQMQLPVIASLILFPYVYVRLRYYLP